MKAWVQHRYGGIDALSFEDRPLVEPQANELRVRVLACGVNATDWELLTAHPAYSRIFGLRKPPKLRVLGSDIVGVVDKLGPGVTGFSLGQRVLADTFPRCGGFAQYAVADAALWVPVPDALDDIRAAALPQSGTIALTAMKGRVRSGTRVLINGAGGGSGPLAVQLAKAAGGIVTAVDNADKGHLLRKLGADTVLDYRERDFCDVHDHYEVILDLFATRSMATVRRMLAPGGRYMVVGGPVPRVLAAALSGLVPSTIQDRRCEILAVQQGPALLPELMAMTLDNKLQPQIGETAPLEQTASALARMGAGAIAGKLVIVGAGT